jgi:hypothetical protein
MALRVYPLDGDLPGNYWLWQCPDHRHRVCVVRPDVHTAIELLAGGARSGTPLVAYGRRRRLGPPRTRLDTRTRLACSDGLDFLFAGDGTDLLLEYMLGGQVANLKRTIEYGSPGR